VEETEIGGRTFKISRVLSRNRNAWARLKDDTIVISLPARWPGAEKERVGGNLLRRAIRAIAKGRWKIEGSRKVTFTHGQKLSAMGKEFELMFIPSGRFGKRARGQRIEIMVDDAHPKKHEKASALARSCLICELMPILRERVASISDSHFRSGIRKLAVRDNSTRWGSCSKEGSISLNFRLLFMPQEILDYVIVHELAHTKYRSHGKRFWALVERIVPDHREKRKWLRENGWSYPKTGDFRGQLTLAGYIAEEPY
jgi:predicted metal-dependent hydrolase